MSATTVPPSRNCRQPFARSSVTQNLCAKARGNSRFRGERKRLILGLETSCDETAAAVVTDDGGIHANIVSSQADLHARYGGVVPEVASRRHLELVSPVMREALDRAGPGSTTSTASPSRTAQG